MFREDIPLNKLKVAWNDDSKAFKLLIFGVDTLYIMAEEVETCVQVGKGGMCRNGNLFRFGRTTLL